MAPAFRAGLGLVTLSGLALHFVLTGTLGGLFGLACGGIHQRGRLILLGMFASLGWYNLANATFWPKVNPWVPAVSPRPATAVSHVLLGACLGYMGHRQRRQGCLHWRRPSRPPSHSLAHPDATQSHTGMGTRTGTRLCTKTRLVRLLTPPILRRSLICLTACAGCSQCADHPRCDRMTVSRLLSLHTPWSGIFSVKPEGVGNRLREGAEWKGSRSR